MVGHRGPARTCDECGRSWERRATYCGACGARLVEVPPARGDPATRGRRPWRPPPRALGVLAAVVVVVAAVAVPTITVERSRAVDGDVALPTEGGAQAADTLPRDDVTTPADATRPPSVHCTRGGQPIACVSWTTGVGAPDRPATRGFGPVGQFGRTVLVVSGTRLSAVDQTTGRLRWHHDTSTGVDGARLESGMVGLEADGRFQLLSVTTGQREWSVEVERQMFGELLYGGLVYTAATPTAGEPNDADVTPTVVARRIEDGAATWQWQPPASWVGDSHRPSDAGRPPLVVRQVDDRHVLVESLEVGLAVLDARSGEVRWRRDDARVVAADELGVLVEEVTDEQRSEPPVPRGAAPPTVLSALHPATGAELWRRPSPADAHGRWTSVQDDLVLVPTSNGLRALDRATGEARWAVQGQEQPRLPFAPPGSDRDAPAVVVTIDAARVRGRSPDTGEVRWESDTRGQMARPVGDHVVVEGERGLDYLDAATGALALQVESTGFLIPVPDAPGILFHMQSRHLIGLDPDLLTTD